METAINRSLIIKYCQDCPAEGNCSAWKSLTKEQIFILSCGKGIPDKFQLKACPLPEDNLKARIKEAYDYQSAVALVEEIYGESVLDDK